MDQRQTFALTDLADAITWAGLGIGVANNDYPHVIVKLGSFNKLIDIAPRQYITASISSGDTPRGIVWTAQKLVPRTIQYTYTSTSGQILVDLDCEGASVPGTGISVPIPDAGYTPPDVSPTPPTPPTPAGVITEKRFGWSYNVGNGVDAIAAGIWGMSYVPFEAVIDLVEVQSLPGTTGTVEFDILRCTYTNRDASTHPASGDSIVGIGAKPALSSGYKSTTDLSGWTARTLIPGDWIYIVVDAGATLLSATIAVSGLAYQ